MCNNDNIVMLQEICFSFYNGQRNNGKRKVWSNLKGKKMDSLKVLCPSLIICMYVLVYIYLSHTCFKTCLVKNRLTRCCSYNWENVKKQLHSLSLSLCLSLSLRISFSCSFSLSLSIYTYLCILYISNYLSFPLSLY